jgi:hypothetical protein
MNATTVAVDSAKNVFQLAYADANWKLVATADLPDPSSSAVSITAASAWSSWKPAAPPTTGPDRFRHWASKYDCCRRSTSGPMSTQ